LVALGVVYKIRKRLPLQIAINIFIFTSILLLLSLSFQLIYSATRFFVISLTAITTLSAYFVLLLSYYIPFLIINIFLSILLATALGVLLEKFIYSPQRAKSNNLISVLISSLGVYIILQNLISLFFGDDTRSIRTSEVKIGRQIFSAYITDIQIVTIAISIFLFMAVLLILQKTSLGRQIRAVSNNPELCNIYGINSDRVILWATAIGTALASVAGILIALDVDMTPTFGFNYFFYGAVAMIIGGVGSYRGLIFGSLLLATAQHLAAYYIDTKWMDAMAYIILILFLIWKPLGFSGQRLKKVEL